MNRLAVTSSITIQRMVRGYIMRCRAGREVAQARLKVLTAYHIAAHSGAQNHCNRAQHCRAQFIRYAFVGTIVMLIDDRTLHSFASKQYIQHLMLLQLLTAVCITCYSNVCMKHSWRQQMHMHELIQA
jgi:hypothetical protein